MSTLSICIIAKNEETNLARCLSSIATIADEIIVVDTGSTDKTIEVAKSFKATIIETIWKNNFATARNLALDNATMDYIMYLDCDEELEKSHAISLKDSLGKKDSIECYCINLINIVDGKKNMRIQSLRIFKNRQEFRFKGRIHEQIFPSIYELYGDSCVEVLYNVDLYHHGYDLDSNSIQNKIKRNLSIFKEYDESEKDGFYYYNLGNEYLRLNDLETATKNYIKATNTPGFDNGFKMFLAIYLVKALFDLKRYDEAIEYANKFISTYEYFSDLLFLKVNCYYESGKFSKAKDAMISFLDSKNKVIGYPEFKLDASSDADLIMKDLTHKSIDTTQNEITTILIIDKDSPHLEQAIKSVNELSNEVIILYDDKYTLKFKELKHYLATGYSYNKKGFDKTLNLISKKIKTPWILILKSGESLTLNEAKLIVKDVNSKPALGFSIPIAIGLTGTINSNELRLFKTSEYKKHANLNKLENLLKQKKALAASSAIIIIV